MLTLKQQKYVKNRYRWVFRAQKPFDVANPSSKGLGMADDAFDTHAKSPDAKAFSVHNSIVLIGMMGAGKTTVGRRLAKRIGLDFVDSDSEIEKAAQMSVSDIFETYGEEYFRDGERRVLTRLLDGGYKVIATGGGAFMDEETRKIVADKATVVWLEASLDVLVERTSRRDVRPLLREGDPRETLSRLLDVRTPIYRQADVTVKSSDGPHDTVVTAVIDSLIEEGTLRD